MSSMLSGTVQSAGSPPASGALHVQPGGKVPGAALARFLELRGYPVAEAGGALWYGVKHGIYMSLPYQLVIELTKEEADGVIESLHGLGVRFPSQRRPGLASGVYVYREKSYDTHNLHRNFRAKVRVGLERCTFREVEEDELLREGLPLNLDTMQRQGRYDPEFGDERRWRRLVRAVRQCPGITALGAYVEDRLAAYAITCLEDGWLHILHRMSRNADLEHCPNHALSFVLTRDAAAHPGIEAVSMGFAPLVPQEGLHEYKRRLGFELIPLNSVIQFHPAVAPILTSRVVADSVRRLSRLRGVRGRLDMISATLNGGRLSRSA